MSHLLSLLLLLPLLGLAVVMALPNGREKLYRQAALAVAFAQFMLAILLWWDFGFGNSAAAGVNQLADFAYLERSQWFAFDMGSMGRLSAEYCLGVDGLSMPMVFLATLVMLIATLASSEIQKKQRGYYALLLLLNTTVIGSFVSLDLLLFYLFFEFLLLPMFFLIGIWGGAQRQKAAMKFLLFTLFGSLLILIVLIGLYQSAIDPDRTALSLGLVESLSDVDAAVRIRVQEMLASGAVPAKTMVHTFNMVHLADAHNYIPGALFHPESGRLAMGLSARSFGFLLLIIGFAIKLPAVPLHTWLPLAHVEAPTPISVILAGILLKVGGYGILRLVLPVFPEQLANYDLLLGTIGVVSILVGGWNALAQNDLKRLVAYSSVAHMGFVLLGIASGTNEGISGAVYQLFSHGLLSAMLFLLVGVIYKRTGSRNISDFAGLAKPMPKYAAFAVVAFFASLGLPGFSGFVAELFVLLGAFGSDLPWGITALALVGLLLGAGYLLWALQRVFFGGLWLRDVAWKSHLRDLRPVELLMLAPLALLSVVFGLFPSALLGVISGSVERIVALLNI